MWYNCLDQLQLISHNAAFITAVITAISAIVIIMVNIKINILIMIIKMITLLFYIDLELDMSTMSVTAPQLCRCRRRINTNLYFHSCVVDIQVSIQNHTGCLGSIKNYFCCHTGNSQNLIGGRLLETECG